MRPLIKSHLLCTWSCNSRHSIQRHVKLNLGTRRLGKMFFWNEQKMVFCNHKKRKETLKNVSNAIMWIMNNTIIQLWNKVKKIVIMTSVIPTIFFKSYLFYLNQWLVVYPFKLKRKKNTFKFQWWYLICIKCDFKLEFAVNYLNRCNNDLICKILSNIHCKC